MDIVSAQDVVRNCLRLYIQDPYVTAGGTARTSSHWIFTGEPNLRYKHPVIFVKDFDNPGRILNIGIQYIDQEWLVINVWFYTKANFKITIGDETYANKRLVNYYTGLIKSTLKTNQTYMWDLGVKGYSKVNTISAIYDSVKQEYYGAATIQVFWYNH